MGIELKGWYLLAKEREPSFRYLVTPAVCNLQDLIAVVPWSLSNVISGRPRVFNPFVESARYAAEYRNYHWQHIRKTSLDAGIAIATPSSAYPAKSDAICDRPNADPGRNFGRLARTGIMDAYMDAARQEPLCGIEAQHWVSFFKVFQDQHDVSVVTREITRLKDRLPVASSGPHDTGLSEVRSILDALERLLEAW